MLIIIVMCNCVSIHHEAKCFYLVWYEHHSWGQRLRNKTWQNYCYQFFLVSCKTFGTPTIITCSQKSTAALSLERLLDPPPCKTFEYWIFITSLHTSLSLWHQLPISPCTILSPVPPPRRMTYFSLIVPNTSVHLPGTFSMRLEPRSHVLTLILTPKQESWEDSS